MAEYYPPGAVEYDPYPTLLPFPERPRDRWTVALVLIVIGAVGGALFGALVGALYAQDHRSAFFGLFTGELSGTLLGALCGALLVLTGLLLYRAIQGMVSGAIVLGLFGMVVMLLVGGLFGALVGLASGLVLGAIAGAAKAYGRRPARPLPGYTQPWTVLGVGHQRETRQRAPDGERRGVNSP